MGFFRLNFNPAPIMMPKTGSNMAYNQLERRPRGSTSSPLLPVVANVRLDVPEAPVMAAGLNEHAGGAVVAGEPLTVMPRQERVTSPPKPPVGEAVIVAFADPPAVTVAGESAVEETTKAGGACTTSGRGALCVSEPEVPITLTV